MVIYNERLLKFQGYREGSFYVLRPADISLYANTAYEDLDNVFSFRKNSKDTFLYEKRVSQGNYIILRKHDFFNLKKEALDKNYDYGQLVKKMYEYNFYRTIDFVRVNTIYIIGSYIQERFIQTENINLPVNALIENEYLDTYIKATPFFRIFNEIKKYAFAGNYYLYCRIENEQAKFELIFDTETIKDLFRKYQSPDYEPFDISLSKSNDRPFISEEKEETKHNIEESLINVAELAIQTKEAYKESDDSTIDISAVADEVDTDEINQIDDI